MKKDSSIVKQSPWEKVYWFSRILINKDKYLAVGKEDKLLSQIAGSLSMFKELPKGKGNTLQLQKQTLFNILREKYKKNTSNTERLSKLIEDLDEEIKTQGDMDAFILTCEHVLTTLNYTISQIPNDDREFAIMYAKALLDEEGEKALSRVISLWDDLGIRACLNIERSQITKAFATLRLYLSNQMIVSDLDKDIILSGFTQEFERRAGQKRKQRAGSSLEDATSFILDYYNIKAANAPEHFQQDIEVDNWIKTKDGWLIGISCKRTLRERWKQVTSADSGVLSKYKIKYIYHIVTFDEDLSDEKLSLLGSLRHIFFLPDHSRRLKNASINVGLKEYVKPISSLITSLRAVIK